MSAGTDELPRLGELELAVLDYLWCRNDGDVHETHAAVGEGRGISPNTVGSALERLYKKGLLSREKVSHAYRYRTTLDREAFRARKVMEAAGGLSGLRKEGVLAAFVDLVASSDDKMLGRLEELIRRKRKSNEP
ncbi:MAG: BlaI/MecI/CopY family transcriptional regulator [Myxococcota bacterium]